MDWEQQTMTLDSYNRIFKENKYCYRKPVIDVNEDRDFRRKKNRENKYFILTVLLLLINI